MSELSLFDAVGEGKTATQDYLDTLSRALLRHHQLVKAIRIYGRYVPESLPMPGLPVLVAVFNHTNVYALHQLPSSQIGQLVLSSPLPRSPVKSRMMSSPVCLKRSGTWEPAALPPTAPSRQCTGCRYRRAGLLWTVRSLC